MPSMSSRTEKKVCILTILAVEIPLGSWEGERWCSRHFHKRLSPWHVVGMVERLPCSVLCPEYTMKQRLLGLVVPEGLVTEEPQTMYVFVAFKEWGMKDIQKVHVKGIPWKPCMKDSVVVHWFKLSRSLSVFWLLSGLLLCWLLSGLLLISLLMQLKGQDKMLQVFGFPPPMLET